MEPQDSNKPQSTDVKWRVVQEYGQVWTHIAVGPIALDGKIVTIELIYAPDGIASLANNLKVAADTALSQQRVLNMLGPDPDVQISPR